MTVELTASGEDTLRLWDARVGFAARIPGHPRAVAVPVPPRSDEPTYDAHVELADAPISIRYRASELPASGGRERAAQLYAETFAANRCRPEDLRRAQPMAPAIAATWGADAAASTLYPLRAADARGDDMEEVLAVVRGDHVVTLTKRFAKARTSAVAWALCNSALTAGLRWGPDAARAEWPPLWPRSSYLLPGIRGVLVAERRDAARKLAELVAEPARRRLADQMSVLLAGSEPPAHVLTAADRAACTHFLDDAGDSPEVSRALVELARDVRTAHDVRGLALLVMHALGKAPATFADGVNPFDYVAE